MLARNYLISRGTPSVTAGTAQRRGPLDDEALNQAGLSDLNMKREARIRTCRPRRHRSLGCRPRSLPAATRRGGTASDLYPPARQERSPKP